MSKHGIVGRVAQLAHANVGAVIDAAEDPRQVLDKLAHDYIATIAEAEHAVAQLEDSRQLTVDDQRADAEAAEMWAAAAATTSQTADELRAAGDAAAADRFDNFARVALARELMAENDVEAGQHTIEAQTESAGILKNRVGRMHAKLSQLTNMRQSLEAGSGARQTPPGRPGRVVRNIDIMDPASEVALFEDVARSSEAQLSEFAGTGADGAPENEIDERLQGLKLARAMASALARAHDQPFR